MSISIGCDHAGYQLRETIHKFLESKGYTVQDHGTFTADSVDYPDFAHRVASDVAHGISELGILICGSGNGVSITANKHAGVRSALCWKPELGALARQHNDANVLCIPARYVSEAEALEIVTAFLDADFEGGRHQNRVDKIEVSC